MAVKTKAKTKKTFIEQMVEEVRNGISVSEVLSERIQLKRSGMSHLALCPFHADKNIGSFVVTDRKSIWKCFSCGEGGDNIKFVSQYDEVSYIEAAFNIALDHKVISEKQYEAHFLKKNYTATCSEQLESYSKNVGIVESPQRADAETLDKVFRLFIEHSVLSKEHKTHLLKTRKLTEERIKEGMYFTFPKRNILPDFLRDIEKNFGSTDVLEEIPGFFYHKEKEEWLFTNAKGLGIGIQNAKEQVIGIQIRRDEDKSPRYYWFSSSFAIDAEDLDHGTSSGSPIDVVFPKKFRNASVLITEGRFKSEILAEATGSVVISVQGVTTWRGVVSELKAIPTVPIIKKKTKNYRVKSVMTAFDSDISENIGVFEQLKEMTDAIVKSGYPVFYLYWDSSFGKGVDDMILAGNQKEIKRYEKKLWDKMYEYMVTMLSHYLGGKDPKMADKETVEEFFEDYMKKIKALKPGEVRTKIEKD